MSDLADRIRASREQWVKAGGFEFNVRRPTALQLARFAGTGSIADSLLACVVDWKVPESEIVAGGGGKVPPFDAEAFREWIEDRPELLGELSSKVTAIINEYAKTRDDAEKKS